MVINKNSKNTYLVKLPNGWWLTANVHQQSEGT